MLHRVQQIAPGQRIRGRRKVGHRALRHHAAAALARARADVDDVVGAADRVLVVLHHHQRVAHVAQLVQGVQQDLVVARMQADGRLVQHVAHTLQMAAELRRQPDALRLAAREGRRAAVQRQVTQPDVFEEGQAAFDLGQQVARDIGLAPGQRPPRSAADAGRCPPGGLIRLGAARRRIVIRTVNTHHGADPLSDFADREAGDVGDRRAAESHGPRLRVQARTRATGARLVHQAVHLGLGEALLAPALVVIAHGIVECLALFAREPNARAHAVRTPAVLAVVGEQARIELRVAGAAGGTGPHGGEHLQRPQALGRAAFGQCLRQPVERGQHMHRALADLQRLGKLAAQPGLVGRVDQTVGHGQLDGVFLEAVDTREVAGRQKLAIHAQMRVAARARPVGQFRIDTLAVDDQGRQQADVATAVACENGRDDAVGALRLHGGTVVHAVLGAELDVEQAQEVPDLRGGADGRFAAAAAQALLDGDGGRDAVHRIDLGPAGGLHDGARVGVEAFEVAALAFVEQNVEGQRGLARTADAGDDVELAARDVDAEVLEVVFLGVDDADRVFMGRRCQGAGGAGLLIRQAQIVARRPPPLGGHWHARDVGSTRVRRGWGAAGRRFGESV